MIKYLLFLMPMLMFKCEKDDLPAGIETQVKGRIFDDVNNLPLASQKVKVAEFTSDFNIGTGGSYDFVGYVDSTYTDTNGYYDLTFTTTGQGSEYRIFYEEGETVWTYYQDAVVINNPGHLNQINFSFLQLYPVNLTVTLDNVVHLPVRMSPPLKPYGVSVYEQNNVPAERLIYVSQNAATTVSFSRKKPDMPTKYQLATYTIPATNTTQLTDFSITVKEEDFQGEY